MKIYVGEIVKNAVYDKRQPIPKNKIAEAIGLSRTQFYNLFKAPEMDVEYILKIGKVIGRDFTREIKGFQTADEDIFESADYVNPYSSKRAAQLQEEILDLQRKYILALEDIIHLKRELSDCQKQLKQ